ncbi:MAG: cell filamentation protein Fic [Deltaproteobacteria bacterium RBG_13_43_22]|nr:MAG: cell filamentation protein Fic [Deltaproteobacteria bacterium RBG_13_43_22]
MDIGGFKAGYRRKSNNYQYFLPEKINHEFAWSDAAISSLLEKASLKLGELNSFARFVPDVDLFIRMHVYNEAVLSSRIEGTKTQIGEALLEEKDINPEKRNDWKEVDNYVAAMNYALDRLKNLPLSTRLIKDTHTILLESVRGHHKRPGEFRRSQNWIGGATLNDAVFVPPIYEEVPELMSDLVKFLHNTGIKVPHLARIAIAHYQFETIHPFLDGNGRMGRLLITLYLVSNGVLERPLLYLSDFFHRHRNLYFDNLMLVREKNDLVQWLKFFLTAIASTAEKSVSTLNDILKLKSSLEHSLYPTLGKRLKTGQAFFMTLFSTPIVTARSVQKTADLSPKAANDLLNKFVELGVLKEATGYQRNRIFVFKSYLDLFSKGAKE